MIIYRSFAPEDIPALAEIVGETWNFRRMCRRGEDPAVMALDYLKGCLAESTAAFVAEEDGKAAGLISVRAEKKTLPRLFLSEKREEADGASPSSESSGVRRMREYEARCLGLRRQAEEAGMKFDGELTLFAVRPKMRGRGAGRELYRRALDYLKEEGCRRFFLYTDSSCTYQFYDARGLACLGRTAMPPADGSSWEFVIFLYGNTDLL